MPTAQSALTFTAAYVALCVITTVVQPNKPVLDTGYPLPLFNALRKIRRMRRDSKFLKRFVRSLRTAILIPLRVIVFAGSIPMALFVAESGDRNFLDRIAGISSVLLSKVLCETIVEPMMQTYSDDISRAKSAMERAFIRSIFLKDLISNLLRKFPHWISRQKR